MGDNSDKDPNNSEKKQVIEQQIYLSDDLIIQEILTRLPVKSVVRFKSVSKQWYSTLSSSNFANAHLMKSPFNHPSAPVNTLFIKSGENCYIFSYNDDQISGNFEDNLVKLDVEFGVGKDNLEIRGCCNGLICLTPIFGGYLVIWNPATRKLHKYSGDGYLSRFIRISYAPVAHGFGYASSVDDYKYVLILMVNFRDETKCSFIFYIFCLRENKWREIDCDLDHDMLPCGGAVLIKEKLYWAPRCGRDGNVIVNFDLGVERFDLIKVSCGVFDLLGVMGGCLSTCNYYVGDKLLQILEPSGAIVKSIGLPERLRLDMRSEIIGFTRTGKFFVTGKYSNQLSDWKRRRLWIVDTRMKPIQSTMLLSFDTLFQIARYVPSLASPFAIEEPLEA